MDLELTDEHEDLVVRISQQGGHRHSLKYKTFHPVQISISFWHLVNLSSHPNLPQDNKLKLHKTAEAKRKQNIQLNECLNRSKKFNYTLKQRNQVNFYFSQSQYQEPPSYLLHSAFMKSQIP